MGECVCVCMCVCYFLRGVLGTGAERGKGVGHRCERWEGEAYKLNSVQISKQIVFFLLYMYANMYMQ